MSPDAARLASVLAGAAAAAGVAGAQLSVVTPDGRADVAVGLADAGRGTSMTAVDRPQVGSIAKLITAVLVHQLVDDGQLVLTEPVTDAAGRHGRPATDGWDLLAGVTVGQLLSMTSGLDWGVWAHGATIADSLSPQLFLPRRSAPGSFGYSFAGTMVAARLVELVRDAGWSACVADHIAGPLGIGPLEALPGAIGVPGHEPTADGWSAFTPATLPGMAPTGTTLRASAADLATLGEALAQPHGPLLSPASHAALHRPVVDVGAVMAADGWCHGPYVRRTSAGVLHGHGGRWAGGVADLTWQAGTGTAVAVTTNTPGRGADLVRRVGREVHRQLWGDDAFVEAVPAAVPTDLGALVGRYLTATRRYDVVRRAGRLVLCATSLPHPAAAFTLPDGELTLVPVGPRRFLPADETRDERRLQEVWFSGEPQPEYLYDGFVAARRARTSPTTSANAAGR